METLKRRFVQLTVIIRYILCLCYVKIFHINHPEVWLISERGDDARDNGYAFYEYMKKNHPEIAFKYIISKKSQDFNRIAKEHLLIYRSWRHFIYFLTSKVLISAHVMGYSPEFRMFQKLDKKNLVFIKGKKVFLQHGIIKDDSPGLYKDATKLDLFICGAKPEYDYVNKHFGYTNHEVVYTGLARYDNLKNTHQKYILLMPTWREYLFHCNHEGFLKSDYYKSYQRLINNKKLIHFLETNNYQLIFYPHYEIQKHLYLFSTSSKNVTIANIKDYFAPDLLKGCELLITDYSSVYFDVAYLKKPVIYYQFDYKEYRSKHYKEGYFSYEEDGFGPVLKTEEKVVNELLKSNKEKWKVSKKYQERRNRFFLYNDEKNCERIYKEILRILDGGIE